MQHVALLGLGVMGAGIARNLLKAGFSLTVWNRTAAKAKALESQGATIAPTPRAAAEGADVVIAIVGDDPASRQVWLGEEGALAGVRRGAVLVECSTLSLDWVRELAREARERGATLLDSPVTGSKDAAEEGRLGLLVGGDAAALEQVRPVLQAISAKIIHFGDSGAGAIMKLVNNLMGAVQAVALAEGLVLAEKAGLDMSKVVPLIINGGPGSPIVKGKAARMVARDYGNVQFALQWMQKDATYALRLADEFGVPMPTVAVAREIYRMARNLGLGEADFSAVAEAIRVGKP